MREGYDEAPFNPVPPVIWALVLPIAGIEAVLSAADNGLIGGALGVGWRQALLAQTALPAGLFGTMVQSGQVSLPDLARFLTYGFVHLSLMHGLIVAIYVLAIGKFVAEVFRPWAVLVVFFGAEIAAGIAFSLFPGTMVALAGGYPAAYGLIGAFAYIIWAGIGGADLNRDRGIRIIGYLIGIQLLFAVIPGADSEWLPKLTGFVVGGLASFIVAPGRSEQILSRLRQR